MDRDVEEWLAGALSMERTHRLAKLICSKIISLPLDSKVTDYLKVVPPPNATLPPRSWKGCVVIQTLVSLPRNLLVHSSAPPSNPTSKYIARWNQAQREGRVVKFVTRSSPMLVGEDGVSQDGAYAGQFESCAELYTAKDLEDGIK
eukprot:169650-Pyramimonas_sp.AAC.1